MSSVLCTESAGRYQAGDHQTDYDNVNSRVGYVTFGLLVLGLCHGMDCTRVPVRVDGEAVMRDWKHFT